MIRDARTLRWRKGDKGGLGCCIGERGQRGNRYAGKAGERGERRGKESKGGESEQRMVWRIDKGRGEARSPGTRRNERESGRGFEKRQRGGRREGGGRRVHLLPSARMDSLNSAKGRSSFLSTSWNCKGRETKDGISSVMKGLGHEDEQGGSSTRRDGSRGRLDVPR